MKEYNWNLKLLRQAGLQKMLARNQPLVHLIFQLSNQKQFQGHTSLEHINLQHIFQYLTSLCLKHLIQHIQEDQQLHKYPQQPQNIFIADR